MAPKAPSISHQPSKEEEEREKPSSDEEEDDEEVGSESQSSKEEQENSSEETEEGSSEDEEEDEENAKNNNIPSSPPRKFDPKSISQENGSDSEPDSDGSPSDYKLQRIGKPSASSAKRGRREVDESQDSSKKLRIEEKKSPSTPGAGCITRLWSNEDEIAVLNGMIDFRKAKGLDPNADMGAFYSFIKGELQVDFSKDQLRTKINRMKKRFLNALKKGGNGSDPVFSKPHEDMAFELSKKIWGGGAVGKGVGSKKGEEAKKDVVKPEKVVVDEKAIVMREECGEGGDFWSRYPFLGASFDTMAVNFPSLALSGDRVSFMKERMSLIGNVEAKKLDEKWKQLILEETELNHKRLNFMIELVKMALNQ